MIVIIDIAVPLAAYGLLRSAGLSPVTALLLSGVFPALGVALGAVRHRRLDVVGALVISKVTPYVWLGALSAWTVAYGSWRKKKGERLGQMRDPAQANPPSTESSRSTLITPDRDRHSRPLR